MTLSDSDVAMYSMTIVVPDSDSRQLYLVWKVKGQDCLFALWQLQLHLLIRCQKLKLTYLFDYLSAWNRA